MSIGLVIKEQRQKLGITQAELATKVDLSLDYIRSLETDRKKPSIETLVKLSELFNCSTDYLLGLDVSEEKMTWNTLIKGLREVDLYTSEKIDELLAKHGHEKVSKETFIEFSQVEKKVHNKNKGAL